MDPFQEGLGLWALPAAAPSTSSWVLPSSTEQLGLDTPAVLCICVYVAIEVFLRSLHSHPSTVCSRLLQFGYLGLHPKRVFIEVLKGPLYEA